jgi:hypothetical protein
MIVAHHPHPDDAEAQWGRIGFDGLHHERLNPQLVTRLIH